MVSKTNNTATIATLFLCLVFTAVIYYPGLTGDFIFDDFQNIVSNKKLQFDDLNFNSLISASLSSYAGMLKRPVSMLSFGLNYYFSGANPYSYKIVNLLIHLMTGIGIFVLTRLILKEYYKSRKQELTQQALYWLPLIICCIWLVHPLNLTSVLYIVQRMTSLASLFTIFGVCMYVWSRSRHIEHNRGFWLIPAGILLFGGLAIFSKESGALLPLFLLLVETTLFRFKNHNDKTDYKIVSLFSIILLIPVTGAIISLIYKPDFLIGGYAYRDFTLTERIMTQARVIIFYLKMIVLPSTTDLGIFHDDILISKSLTKPLTTMPAIAAILGMLSLGLALMRKHPLLGFGILWFFVGHTLESTIIPLEMAHEHRNYLADYGVIFFICYLINISGFTRQRKLIRYSSVLIAISLLSGITFLRAHQWGDTTLHAIFEAEHHPNSQRSTYESGRAYANLTLYKKHDKAEEAFQMLERSRILDNKSIQPNISLIILSYKLGRPVKYVWIKEAREKLRSLPITTASINSLLELVKCQSHRCKLTKDEMNSLLTSALENRSTHNLSNILTVYAYNAFNNYKDYNLSYSLFREAIEISPNTIQYRINFIDLLLAMKLHESAHTQLKYIKENNTFGKYNTSIARIQNALAKESPQ